MPEPDAICPSCGDKFSGTPRTGPFGFRVLDCPSCKKRTWYPLARIWRITYWVTVGLSCLALVALLGTGTLVVPAAASVLAAVVLIRDAILRKSARNTAAVSAVVTSGVVAAVFSVAMFIGLSNAYVTTVVDQPETTETVFNGIDLRESTPICGDNDDYNLCVNMHVAMYNSVCVAYPSWSEELTVAGRSTCEELNDFIHDVKKRYASCGGGCVTIASGGKWGYPYLVPVPRTAEVIHDAVTHDEYCWFSLGLVQLGTCPEGHSRRDRREWLRRASIP